MAGKLDMLMAVLAFICAVAGFWEETGWLILIAVVLFFLFLCERPFEALARQIKNRKSTKSSHLTW